MWYHEIKKLKALSSLGCKSGTLSSNILPAQYQKQLTSIQRRLNALTFSSSNIPVFLGLVTLFQ